MTGMQQLKYLSAADQTNNPFVATLEGLGGEVKKFAMNQFNSKTVVSLAYQFKAASDKDETNLAVFMLTR